MGIGQWRPIEIKQAIRQDTDSGGGTDEWETVVNTWAKVAPVRNFWALQNSQTNIQGVFSFKEIRVDESYEPKKNMQIVYNGSEYTITGVEKIESTPPFYYNITAEIVK